MTAVLTGTQAHIAHLGLEAADWTVVADNVLVLVRIDHEEPYWAQDAAKHLNAEGITVEIAPRLQEAMDKEWTWANYPMPWCTRSGIREVSNEAQKIHDDVRHGQLLNHAHDGHTTAAVGTYLGRNGKSVYLHGEDHLRQVVDTFGSPAGAMLAFEKVHGAEMRPGPALLTDTERAAAETRTPLALTAAKPDPARPEPETVPAYLADAGDQAKVSVARFLTGVPVMPKNFACGKAARICPARDSSSDDWVRCASSTSTMMFRRVDRS
ncbi:hypothetical protein ACWCQ0_35875 [Streptomyces massasporeus]|uniref:hypothetical protein n=1 Tax=Streptomyces massasporeus TaxID=67324 RepID=UPI003F5421E5